MIARRKYENFTGAKIERSFLVIKRLGLLTHPEYLVDMTCGGLE
jgi:hypothetical protein